MMATRNNIRVLDTDSLSTADYDDAVYSDDVQLSFYDWLTVVSRMGWVWVGLGLGRTQGQLCFDLLHGSHNY